MSIASDPTIFTQGLSSHIHEDLSGLFGGVGETRTPPYGHHNSRKNILKGAGLDHSSLDEIGTLQNSGIPHLPPSQLHASLLEPSSATRQHKHLSALAHTAIASIRFRKEARLSLRQTTSHSLPAVSKAPPHELGFPVPQFSTCFA